MKNYKKHTPSLKQQLKKQVALEHNRKYAEEQARLSAMSQKQIQDEKLTQVVEKACSDILPLAKNMLNG